MNTKHGEMDRIMSILIAAREIIAEPRRWTTNALARTQQLGKPIGPNTPGATCWCALGAMQRATTQLARSHPWWVSEDYDGAVHFMDKLAIEFYPAPESNEGYLIGDPPNITELNDAVDHETIIAFFDEGIARAGRIAAAQGSHHESKTEGTDA